MKYVLLAFKDYDIRYDTKTKIIHVYEKITVKDFVRLKIMLKSTSAEVSDIRVN